jgi:hypothetical protein
MSKALKIINEMVFHRKDAIDKVKSLQMEISSHAYKIIVYPNHSSYKAWIKELNAWISTLSRYHRGKNSKKNYTPDLLLKHLYIDPLGTNQDLETLNKIMVNNGFPEIDATSIDKAKLKKSIEFIIDAIINTKKIGEL